MVDVLENCYRIVIAWFPIIQTIVEEFLIYNIECSRSNVAVIVNYIKLAAKVIHNCARFGIVDEGFLGQMSMFVKNIMDRFYNSGLILAECNEFIISLAVAAPQAVEIFGVATMNFILSSTFMAPVDTTLLCLTI